MLLVYCFYTYLHLQKETQAGMYDLFMHVGDFAYDMHSVKGYFL